MHKLIKGLVIVSIAVLAGCQTAPVPVAPKVAEPEAQPLPYRWTHGNAEKARQAMIDNFRRAWLATGDSSGPSRCRRRAIRRSSSICSPRPHTPTSGDVLVGAASVSSAKTGKVTPLGFWKVLEKRKEYRSKKYNNASMPFMQRIDEYGIALHGGVNPGFPASQGCVRMPMKFAEKLFGLTKLGTEVVIEG